MHAVGQGRLGIEIREDDARMKEILSTVSDEKAHLEALVERSVMRTLEGGCSVPIGVETEWVKKSRSLGLGAIGAGVGVGVGAKPAEEYHQLSGEAKKDGEEEDERSDELLLKACVVSLDGSRAVESEMRRIIRTKAEADQFGWDMAGKLVEGGAADILKDINLNRGIIEEQGKA